MLRPSLAWSAQGRRVAALFLLPLLALAGGLRAAAPVWGGELPALPASTTGPSISSTLTLGASGANSILIVIIDAATNFSAPVISYNGLSMTALAAVVSYAGSQQVYRQIFYITHPVSGQTLSIANGAPTTLNNGGGTAWQYQWFTYAAINETAPFGTLSVNATNLQTSAINGTVTVSFNFTPSSAGSTIVQMARFQGNTCNSAYAAANGTVRRSIQQQFAGGNAMGWAFSDYAPGSTSTYSLSQSWNPSSCGQTMYGWGIELMPVATNTPTATTTPTASATRTITPYPTGNIVNIGSNLWGRSNVALLFVRSPTQTPTASSTGSSSATPSSTLTATGSPTGSPTYTITGTPTMTGSNTVTPTETGSSTETPTETGSSTETPSETGSSTESPTPTVTISATMTPVLTATPNGILPVDLGRACAFGALGGSGFSNAGLSSLTGDLGSYRTAS